MSITDTINKLQTPAQKYWKFKGGEFQYWDKEAKENKITNKLRFIVLDQNSFITGFHEPTNTGIVSNFVKNTKTNPFSVRTFSGFRIAEGLYQDIKGKLQGGSYARGVFIYNLDSKEIEHLQISGGTLGVLIEMKPKFKDSFAYEVTKDPTPRKKGATTYYVMEFNKIEVSVKEFETALEKGKIVDEYVNQYLGEKENLKLETTTQNIDGVVFELEDNSVPDVNLEAINNVKMPF